MVSRYFILIAFLFLGYFCQSVHPEKCTGFSEIFGNVPKISEFWGNLEKIGEIWEILRIFGKRCLGDISASEETVTVLRLAM
jgi:hypothetical protein